MAEDVIQMGYKGFAYIKGNDNTYKDSQDINRLVKDIGNECRVQEAARLQIPVR